MWMRSCRGFFVSSLVNATRQGEFVVRSGSGRNAVSSI